MARSHLPTLRILMLALLVLGSIVRPILVVSCEIHAAAFAHAANPHVHRHLQASAGDGDAGQESSTHGEHDPDQLGAFSGAAFAQAAFTMPILPRMPSAVPPHPRASVPEPYPTVPFRPPIA